MKIPALVTYQVSQCRVLSIRGWLDLSREIIIFLQLLIKSKLKYPKVLTSLELKNIQLENTKNHPN